MNIDHVNLSRIDLNLLVALDALLTERSVTRAAARVGLGQSAMSHNLARLRTLFGDELLTRGSEGMRPTPRALALIDPVRIALAQITALWCPRTRRSTPGPPSGCSGSACRTASRCCLVRRCSPISARQRPASGCACTPSTGSSMNSMPDRLDLAVGYRRISPTARRTTSGACSPPTPTCACSMPSGSAFRRRSRSRTMCGCRTC